MTNFKELEQLIKRLKNVLKTVRDDTAYSQLESFINELESDYECQVANFNTYFGQ